MLIDHPLLIERTVSPRPVLCESTGEFIRPIQIDYFDWNEKIDSRRPEEFLAFSLAAPVSDRKTNARWLASECMYVIVIVIALEGVVVVIE